MDPVGMARLREKAGDFAHRAAQLILIDVLGDVPIDTGALLRSLHLERRHMATRLWVGTDHWAYTEYGVPPHTIRPIFQKVLTSGPNVFGHEVHHPGVPEVAYMRRNFYRYRVITSWA